MKIVTPEEVKQAAEILERVSALYDMDTKRGEWSAADLLAELPHIEQTAEEQAIYNRIAEPLVHLALTAGGLTPREITDRVFEVLRQWEIRKRLWD